MPRDFGSRGTYGYLRMRGLREDRSLLPSSACTVQQLEAINAEVPKINCSSLINLPARER